MSKSRRQNWRSSALLFAATFFFVTSVTADGVKQATRRLTKLDQTLVLQNQEIQKTSEKLDQLSAEIHTLKKKSTLLRPYRLQSRLRKAQEVSDYLDQLVQEMRQTQKVHQQTQIALIHALDRSIESNRKVANSPAESWKKRIAAAKTLEGLLVQRMDLSASTPPRSLPTNTSVLLQKETAQDDAAEKVIALRDLEKRMKDELASLNRELKDARRQRFLHNELRHLFDEEIFFAEQGFVRGAGTRKEKESAPGILAQEDMTTDEGKTAISDSPGETAGALPADAVGQGTAPANPAPPPPDTNAPLETADPEVAPTDLEMSDPLPEMATKDVDTHANLHALQNAESLSAQISATPNALGETNERDPLARLANEFGLSHPERREDKMRTSSPVNGQVRWLENRIATIQWILEQLRVKTRKLEQQTVRH